MERSIERERQGQNLSLRYTKSMESSRNKKNCFELHPQMNGEPVAVSEDESNMVQARSLESTLHVEWCGV